MESAGQRILFQRFSLGKTTSLSLSLSFSLDDSVEPAWGFSTCEFLLFFLFAASEDGSMASNWTNMDRPGIRREFVRWLETVESGGEEENFVERNNK